MSYFVTTTPGAIINAAFDLVNALEGGETATAEESQSALGTLRRMVDTWNGTKVLIPNAATKDFVITTAGNTTWTVGPTGDLVSAQPVMSILGAYVRADDIDYPLSTMTRAEYLALPGKATTTGRPTRYFWEPTFPNGTLYINCIPDKSYTLRLNVLGAMVIPTSLTESLQLHPGDEEAMIYNLAARLLPKYPGAPNPDQIFGIASDLLAAVKLRNLRVPDAEMPDGLPGTVRRGGSILDG